MSSRFPEIALLAALAAVPAAARELAVCADPDNLPFSHADRSGFENRIVEAVAREMGATVRYEWAPMRRGFVRKTLGEGACEVIPGVPVDFERVLATRPYYRSTYVFVSRADRPLESFDDPRITRALVGVQLVGNDLAATPPGHALAARGAIDNVRGFTVYGEGPAAERLVRAIATGQLEAGVVWGPPGAYFAARSPVKLAVTPAAPPPELAGLRFDFAIAMGVARGNRALRDEIDAALARIAPEIDAILADYAVPRVERKRP